MFYFLFVCRPQGGLVVRPPGSVVEVVEASRLTARGRRTNGPGTPLPRGRRCHAMATTDCASICFVGFLHGCNKIHDWGLPCEPAACQQCTRLARHYNNDAELRRKFLHMVFLDMCTEAGGYYRDHRYLDAFCYRWAQHAPGDVLVAVAASKYPTRLADTKVWCRSTYPPLAHFLWTTPTTRTICCCTQALDEMD